MVYIYKKTIGNKDYYYLRASVNKKGKSITKDIAYLGNDIESSRDKLKELQKTHPDDIRRAYKTLKRFLESNYYLEKISKLKIRENNYLDKKNLLNVEACKLHWETSFQKIDDSTKNEILKNFIIEFTFNTTSIEGNTITLKEAQKFLTENITPKEKTLREVYDVRNTDKVFFEMMKETKNVNHELICKIHDSLLMDIDERKGYRTTDVRVFKMNFEATPAPYVITDMNLLIKWYNEYKSKLHPLILATIFHHKFEKIHPFMDGNGRTGRILANYILLRNNYPPLIIRKTNRTRYLNLLNSADKVNLTKTDEKGYYGLCNFVAEEFYETYWNIFI